MMAAQVLGNVVRRYGHFDIAKDAVQDAMLAAATQWPNEGLPDNPKGWLALYELLLQISDNPIIALNHAVAVAMDDGATSGLQRLEVLATDKRLAEDHRLYAVRAHLLEMSGETAAACEAYRAAARRASNLPQQRYLNARAERLIRS
jgi:predicted RNA polymerase sigma factor